MSREPLCSYCQSLVGADDASTACPDCGAPHHEECWRENGGCSIYGCKQTPPTEARTELEVPVSWWGQQHKPCPSCGNEILAAALRCRHCGATFASARPEGRDEFAQRARVKSEHPGLRTRVVWMFILSVLPLSAPVGMLMGLLWYLPKRNRVDTLPGVFPPLARLGLVVAIAQTGAFAVLFSLYIALEGAS